MKSLEADYRDDYSYFHVFSCSCTVATIIGSPPLNIVLNAKEVNNDNYGILIIFNSFGNLYYLFSVNM